MNKQRKELGKAILEVLEKTPGMAVKELAEKLGVNRVFLSGYLRALEKVGVVKSRRVGPAILYYKVREWQEKV